MNHLIIDPGDQMGFCVVRIDNDTKTLTIIDYGFYDLDKKAEYLADACLQLEAWIQTKIDKHKIVEIAREDYFFSRSYATGSKKNVHYRASIDRIARVNKLHYEIINISLWKRFICGRTTPTKQQIQQYTKTNAKKYMTQEGLWENYGIKFPNYSLNGKRKIKFRHDIIDAVAMAVYYGCIIKKCIAVKCEVECPDDIEWGNKRIRVFDYTKIKQKYKCDYTFKTGNRKGLMCGKISQDVKCQGHQVKKSATKCGHIIKIGKRKGQKCGKGCRGEFCSPHRPKEVKPKEDSQKIKKKSEKKETR